MQGILQRVFSIYPGEGKNAIYFAVLAFFAAFGITSGLKFADALFLIHVGADQLPTAYTFCALSMLFLATFLLKSFNKINPTVILPAIVSVSVVFYAFAFICFYFDLGDDSKWIWYALKIFGYLFYTLVTTGFWTFVDQYYHLQDSKRLFTLFTSMLFVGAGTTGLVMRSGYLDLDQLLLMIMGIYVFMIFWIRKIKRESSEVAHEDLEPSEESNSLRYFIKSVLSSRFTLLLMAANILMQLMLITTEYNYLSTFDEVFHPGPVEVGESGTSAGLTIFLGQLIAAVSIWNLFFGLVIYSRLVRRFGITSLIICSPILLILAYSGWLLSDSLLFPIMGFFYAEGTIIIIDDNNFNLLLNAVPVRLKYKIRVTIESFFEPIGMLTSALLLYFAPIDSRLLGLILASIWLCVALAVKRRYLQGIFQNLAENAIHFARSTRNWLQLMNPKEQRSAELQLLELVNTGDEKTEIFATEGLMAFDDEDVLRKLLVNADHMTSQAKIQFLDQLDESNFAIDSEVLDLIDKWESHEGQSELGTAIQFYLAKHGLLHPDRATMDLHSQNITLQGAALLSLRKSWAHLPASAIATNRSLAAEQLKSLLESSQEEKVCMGLKILGIDSLPSDIDLMLPFLKSRSLLISRAAASSIAKIATPESARHASLLIDVLGMTSDHELRTSCLKALGKIRDSSLVKPIISSSIHFRPSERRLTESILCDVGLRTVPTLLAITKDTTMHDRCRVLAGRILGRLSLPQLRANLSDIIKKEIERAHFYFYNYHTIQGENPNIDLKLLEEALLTGYHSVIDFIIQLLGVAGEVEDCELLSRSMRSSNPKVRSQVIETLEKTCEPEIFRILQPLVLDFPHELKMSAYVKGGREASSLNDLLNRMDESPSQVDRIIAATLKYKLNLPGWQASLRKQMATSEETFHNFAYELLESS